jgi:hypothetical protein
MGLFSEKNARTKFKKAKILFANKPMGYFPNLFASIDFYRELKAKNYLNIWNYNVYAVEATGLLVWREYLY